MTNNEAATLIGKVAQLTSNHQPRWRLSNEHDQDEIRSCFDLGNPHWYLRHTNVMFIVVYDVASHLPSRTIKFKSERQLPTIQYTLRLFWITYELTTSTSTQCFLSSRGSFFDVCCYYPILSHKLLTNEHQLHHQVDPCSN